jgi:hypothetical protein
MRPTTILFIATLAAPAIRARLVFFNQKVPQDG